MIHFVIRFINERLVASSLCDFQTFADRSEDEDRKKVLGLPDTLRHENLASSSWSFRGFMIDVGNRVPICCGNANNDISSVLWGSMMVNCQSRFWNTHVVNRDRSNDRPDQESGHSESGSCHRESWRESEYTLDDCFWMTFVICLTWVSNAKILIEFIIMIFCMDVRGRSGIVITTKSAYEVSSLNLSATIIQIY